MDSIDELEGDELEGAELEDLAVAGGASVGGVAMGAAGVGGFATGPEAPSIIVTERDPSSSARAYGPIHSTAPKTSGCNRF